MDKQINSDHFLEMEIDCSGVTPASNEDLEVIREYFSKTKDTSACDDKSS